MDARQDQDVDHVALFTGLVAAPTSNVNGPVETHDLTCYSVLEPLNSPMILGDYIPYGMNAGDAIKRLLLPTPAPVQIDEGAPALDDYIVAEENETNITMIEKILKAISTDEAGWQLAIDGDGTIHVRRMPVKPTGIFSAIEADVLESALSKERDWFNCPNVFRASSGDAYAVARDDDPASPLSTVARGREITVIETDVTLSADEGIEEYAKRRLAEEQQVFESADYTRRFIPGIYVGDLVSFNYGSLQGVFEVKTQDISLTYNGQTKEKAERVAGLAPAAIDVIPDQQWNRLVLPDNTYLVLPDDTCLLMPVKMI